MVERHYPRKIVGGIMALLATGSAPVQAAGENLYFRFLYERFSTAYHDTLRYDQATGDNAFLYLDYLDRGGLIWGKGGKTADSRDDSLQVEEETAFYSAKINVNADTVAGKLSLRYDNYRIKDDSTVGFQYFDGSWGQFSYRDQISAHALLFSYLSYTEDFYLETGYASTGYQANRRGIDDLEVKQLTPGIGVDFNGHRGWALARAYLIDHDGSNRLDRKRHSNGFQIKVTHWLRAPYYYPSNLQLGLRTGHALMPVDYDAAAVYTSPAVLTRAWSLAAEWQLNQHLRTLLYAGRENFSATYGVDNYTAKTLYMNISALW